MKIRHACEVVSLATLLAACARTPDVEVRYYLPQTDASVHVVRTVACDAAANVYTTSAVTTAITHSADLAKPRSFALKDLDGEFSDTEIQVQLQEDGRLKSINGASTGQVESTIKPLLALATTMFGASPVRTELKPAACSFSKDPTKPTTLTFTRHLDLSKLGKTSGTGAPTLSDLQYIGPDPDYVEMFKKTSAALGFACVRLQRLAHDSGGNVKPYLPGVIRNGDPANTVEIALQQPALVGLTVFRAENEECKGNIDDETTLWSGQGPVAQLGTEFKLPIPKARLFGKLQFNLVMAESGAITSLQYTKQTGAAIAATTANEIVSAAAPGTAAQQASEFKSEADLIVQQQRLIRCQANPKSCS